MLTSILFLLTLLSAECPRGPGLAVHSSPLALLRQSPSNPSLPPREGGGNHLTTNPVVPSLVTGVKPGQSIESLGGGQAAGTTRSQPTIFLRHGTVVLSPLPPDEHDQGSYVPSEAVDEEREEEGSDGQGQANLDLAEAHEIDSRVTRLGSSPTPHPSLLTDRCRSTRGPPTATPSS